MPRQKLTAERTHVVLDAAPVDRALVLVAVSGASDDRVRGLLDDAIGLLPDAQLREFAERSFDPAEIRAQPAGKLLESARAFHAASLRGDFYEQFRVDSKNYMSKSAGSRTWIAECAGLLGRCERASTGNRSLAEARAAYELVFELIDKIDEDSDSIVFFADEAGIWQLDIEWVPAIAGWLRCLAATAAPDLFAGEAGRMIERRRSLHRSKLFAHARGVATKEQRAALEAGGWVGRRLVL